MQPKGQNVVNLALAFCFHIIYTLVMSTFLRLTLLWLIVALLACDAKQAPSLRLGVSSSLAESGLLDVLIQPFESENAFTIQVTVDTSQQIHQLIEQGQIDTAITQGLEEQQALLQKGMITSLSPLMKNDFIIIGPQSDPAHIKHSLTPDEAFKKIVNAGALFITRGDQSSTHQVEMFWWQQAGNKPDEKNYHSTGKSMTDTLAIAIEKQAYTLIDRATWAHHTEASTLTVLFEDADLLANVYRLLQPKTSNDTALENIKTWETWITAGRGRQLIANYQLKGKPVFFTIDL